MDWTEMKLNVLWLNWWYRMNWNWVICLGHVCGLNIVTQANVMHGLRLSESACLQTWGKTSDAFFKKVKQSSSSLTCDDDVFTIQPIYMDGPHVRWVNQCLTKQTKQKYGKRWAELYLTNKTIKTIKTKYYSRKITLLNGLTIQSRWSPGWIDSMSL